MKAAQKLNKLLKEDLTKYDTWIETDMFNMFLSSGSETIHLDSKEVYNKGWNKESFMKKLCLEGFHVVYECLDRPCASPYYKITLPPQGE